MDVNRMTNADKIRSMSIERLAKIIEDGKNVFDCDKCEGKEKGHFYKRKVLPIYKEIA